jgi:hypothetical protein
VDECRTESPRTARRRGNEAGLCKVSTDGRLLPVGFTGLQVHIALSYDEAMAVCVLAAGADAAIRSRAAAYRSTVQCDQVGMR